MPGPLAPHPAALSIRSAASPPRPSRRVQHSTRNVCACSDAPVAPRKHAFLQLTQAGRSLGGIGLSRRRFRPLRARVRSVACALGFSSSASAAVARGAAPTVSRRPSSSHRREPPQGRPVGSKGASHDVMALRACVGAGAGRSTQPGRGHRASRLCGPPRAPHPRALARSHCAAHPPCAHCGVSAWRGDAPERRRLAFLLLTARPTLAVAHQLGRVRPQAHGRGAAVTAWRPACTTLVCACAPRGRRLFVPRVALS